MSKLVLVLCLVLACLALSSEAINPRFVSKGREKAKAHVPYPALGAPAALPKVLNFIWFGGEISDAYAEHVISTVQKQGFTTVKLWVSTTYSKPNAKTDTENKVKNRLAATKLGAKKEEVASWATLDVVDIDGSGLIPNPSWQKTAMDLEWGWADGCGANYGALSDIARLLILQQHGGFYADFDVIIRSTPKLLEGHVADLSAASTEITNNFKAPYGFRVGKVTVGPMVSPVNSIMASVANGDFVNRYLAQVQAEYTAVALLTAPERSARARGKIPGREGIRQWTEQGTGPARISLNVFPDAQPAGLEWPDTAGKDIFFSDAFHKVEFDNTWIAKDWNGYKVNQRVEVDLLGNNQWTGVSVRDLACGGGITVTPPVGAPVVINNPAHVRLPR